MALFQKDDQKQVTAQASKKSSVAPARNASPARSRYSVSGGRNDAGGGKKTVFAQAKVETKPSILAHRFLLKPRITEKAYALNGANQFVFEVSRDAHKSVIARSVQEAYGVDVIDVRTVNLPGKSKVFGKNGTVGSRSAVKKAIVTIKKGQSIELFATGV